MRFRLKAGPASPPTLGPWEPARTGYLYQFEPRARQHRRRRLIAGVLLLVPLAGLITVAETRLVHPVPLWAVAVVVACILVSCLIVAFGLRLRCPACGERLERASGQFCPQCGSDRFEHGRWRRGPSRSPHVYCPSCDGTIDGGSSDMPRTYKIRGCTHCGALLDERGL